VYKRQARNNLPADDGSTEAGLLLDRGHRLAHDLRPARVRDAAMRVAEQLPEPSALPPTRSTAELTEPQRRAAHQLENPPQGALHHDEKTKAPTHYEDADGNGYDVHDPHDTEHPELTKGEGLPLSLAAGLDALHASGDWHGRPYADGTEPQTAPQIAAHVREAMSDQALREPELAATWYGPELGDTFTPEDLDAAGLTGRLDDRHQREFAQDGVLHGDLRLAPRASGDARHAPDRGGYRVPLLPDEKAALLSRQLLRGGDAEIGGLAEAGYDNAASDYVPQLFANRHAAVSYTPGQGALVYRPWRPDAAPDAGPGRPTVHLLLDDGAFKALIPRSPRGLPEETDPRHSPNGVPERENAGPPRDQAPVATPSRTKAENPASPTQDATPGTPGGDAGLVSQRRADRLAAGQERQDDGFLDAYASRRAATDDIAGPADGRTGAYVVDDDRGRPHHAAFYSTEDYRRTYSPAGPVGEASAPGSQERVERGEDEYPDERYVNTDSTVGPRSSDARAPLHSDLYADPAFAAVSSASPASPASGTHPRLVEAEDVRPLPDAVWEREVTFRAIVDPGSDDVIGYATGDAHDGWSKDRQRTNESFRHATDHWPVDGRATPAGLRFRTRWNPDTTTEYTGHGDGRFFRAGGRPGSPAEGGPGTGRHLLQEMARAKTAPKRGALAVIPCAAAAERPDGPAPLPRTLADRVLLESHAPNASTAFSREGGARPRAEAAVAAEPRGAPRDTAEWAPSPRGLYGTPEH
ncbi:hypothetical protein ADK38_03940, partial [Streptomyces varsoviensis]